MLIYFEVEAQEGAEIGGQFLFSFARFVNKIPFSRCPIFRILPSEVPSHEKEFLKNTLLNFKK